MTYGTASDTKVETTVTDNYIDVKYEYFGLPDENGLRLRTRDVWFATKPTVPEFHVVDKDDNPIPEWNADVSTAWTISKAGLNNILICDVDDINGLRALLDKLEQDFEKRAMDELLSGFEQDEEDSTDEG